MNVNDFFKKIKSGMNFEINLISQLKKLMPSELRLLFESKEDFKNPSQHTESCLAYSPFSHIASLWFFHT